MDDGLACGATEVASSSAISVGSVASNDLIGSRGASVWPFTTIVTPGGGMSLCSSSLISASSARVMRAMP